MSLQYNNVTNNIAADTGNASYNGQQCLGEPGRMGVPGQGWGWGLGVKAATV